MSRIDHSSSQASGFHSFLQISEPSWCSAQDDLAIVRACYFDAQQSAYAHPYLVVLPTD